MSVRVYVEGGGNARSTKDACREGFRNLFTKIVPPESAPKVIASGGRQKAYQNFCDALRSHPDQTIMLGGLGGSCQYGRMGALEEQIR